MNPELSQLLQCFIDSGSDLISAASSDWLSGRIPRCDLELAIKQAQTDVENTDHTLVAQLNRILELLASEPNGYYYGKLVRDNIPAMILQQGYTPGTKILDDTEYLSELYRKLREETEEFLKDENEEEIADILEVIEAICAAKGYSQNTILRIKSEKRRERGGFEQRLYLINKT